MLVIAIKAGDEEFQARALWELWNTMLSCADIHASLRYATCFQQFVENRGSDWQRILSDQMLAGSLHCFGEHGQARERLENTLTQLAALRYEVPGGGRFVVDPLIFSNGTLARIAWLQGFPDRAMTRVEVAVNLVRADTLEPSLSHVLVAAAVPLALMSGDLKAAERYLEVLRSQVALHGFEIWHDCCECLAAQLDILSGRTERGLAKLEAALDTLCARGFRRLLTPSIAVCAETLAKAGRTADATTRLDEVLQYCNAHGEHLFVPEVWRVMGVVALEEARLARSSGSPHAIHEVRAQRCLLTAIEIAREHGARMGELRASLVLAKFLRSQGCGLEALNMLRAFSAHVDPQSRAADIRALSGLMTALSRELEHRSAQVQGDCLGSIVETLLVCQQQPSDL